MLAKLSSITLHGIAAIMVEVEVNVGTGLGAPPSIVGLPDASVRESLDRVRTALNNAGYYFPGQSPVLINLAPADIRKEGAVLDLPIALGLMKASEQLPVNNLEDFVVVGELALDGVIRPIKGVLSMTMKAKELGFKGILVPKDNAVEAGIVEGIEVYPVASLQDAVGFFTGDVVIPPAQVNLDLILEEERVYNVDFNQVHGNDTAKRALTVAAAGAHNAIMIGPPGSGKTMLAKRVPSIMPNMTQEECLQATRIHSSAGEMHGHAVIGTRPFRTPHHTVSNIAMVGGGQVPRPGEISLAHNGILFLDELPEFSRNTLEVLRQPLEDGHININRAAFSASYPARFMMIAAMNPCPCGFLTDPRKACSCSPLFVQRYLSKISGPLLDRIDIHLDVPAVNPRDLQKARSGASSKEIRQQVTAARAIQTERFAESTTHNNAGMTEQEMEDHCKLDPESQEFLHQAMESMNLSARAYFRILKVARSIADMDKQTNINEEHLAEAVQYRNLDKN